MIRTRSVLVAVMATVLVVGMVPAPAAGQEEVTLTVSVQTPEGASVADAQLNATWDGGWETAETKSNGKALVDVPAGASVEISVNHVEYIRNNPYGVSDASGQGVDITVYDRASTTFEVEDDDGPVDDASVTMFKHNRVAFAQQTENGKLATGDLEVGEYLVTVEKNKYFDESFTMVLEPGENPPKNVTIEQGTVTLHLNVSDHYFDPPRPVAGVTAEVGGVGSVQTQSNGKQQINVPVNTRQTVTFSKEGYLTVEETITVEESSLTLDTAIQRTDEINVTVLNDEVVVGQPVFIEVVDEYDDPVADGTVLLDGTEVATTDEDGRARLTLEAKGEHSIQVRKAGVDSGETVVTGVIASTSTTTTTTTTTTTEARTTEAPIPGFGPIVAVVGMLTALGFAVRRRLEK